MIDTPGQRVPCLLALDFRVRRGLDLADDLAVLPVPDEQDAVGAARPRPGRRPSRWRRRRRNRRGRRTCGSRRRCRRSRTARPCRPRRPRRPACRAPSGRPSPACPPALNVRTCSPVSKSQSLITLSPPPVTICLPSPFQSTARTWWVCPSNDFSSLPSATRVTFRNLSAPALASSVPSGLNRRPKTVSEWSAVERPDEQPLADLPELDLARPRRLAAARREQRAVGVEVERQDAEGVRAERLHLRPPALVRPRSSASCRPRPRRSTRRP